MLTIGLRKKDNTAKFCMVTVNGVDQYHVDVPPTKSWSATGRIQVRVQLKAGGNTVKIHNPVASRFDSAALQYQNMGVQLKKATKEYAKRTGQPEKPIVYSICEWGWNKPINGAAKRATSGAPRRISRPIGFRCWAIV